MTWSIRGRYFENCSCDMPCPCTISLDAGADKERCNAVLVFHVDTGEVDGVDVSDRTVVAVVDSPQVMADGNWKLGLVVDERTSDDQLQKLGAVFGGELGGPMEALGPLVGEMLGVERMRIEVSEGNGNHRLTAGDAVEVDVDDVVPFGVENGQPVRLVDVFHPAGNELTVAKGRSRVGVLGLEWNQEATSGFSAPFSWSG
ncbi:hypothetical protein FHX44_116114 [Pseudonocardia hierapolitana]|uniref:VldV n=1 Tax=Pseudonocardia hierapolitana TaxID=1128676 RepID=A0A561SZ81_9PSEU|nr:DUF1326 domain-containing protein [Pseudonocardia hierapolitana]TWF80176.1 hypothetical protein FHX44_116114 [Pseudonocardia hierapolitana]